MSLSPVYTYADSHLTVKDCSGNTVVDNDFPTLIGSKKGSYAGARTPHFHQVVEKGGVLPLNYYNRWDYEMSRQLVSGEATCDCGGGKVHTATMTNWMAPVANYLDPTNPSNIIPNPWEGVNTDALILAAMADILPDLDALTSAIEFKKTVDMIVNARRDAKDLIQSALRGGKHTVKAAADAWMAWRYGWQILGMDISNIYDFLKEPVLNVVMTGQSGDSSTIDGMLPSWEDHYYEHGALNHGRFTQDVSLRARVVARWRGRTLNAIADPAISLWETIPYSFVADWFVNVGDVLGAWNVRCHVDSIYASLGSKVEMTSETHRDFTEGLCDNITVPSGGGTARERFTWKQRVPASIPSLVPSINVQLTGKRVIDAASILAKRIL